MRRAQRKTHRVIWFILAPLLLAAFLWAVFLRPDATVDALPKTVQEEGR